ncbi:MAG: asparagine synthase-related protein [Gammaproteobacteria bacterium]|nr:asparagine synthase-related protein [Gammaproteobacteria bacterium]
MKTIKVYFKIKQGKLQSKSNLDAQLAYLKQAGYRFTHTPTGKLRLTIIASPLFDLYYREIAPQTYCVTNEIKLIGEGLEPCPELLKVYYTTGYCKLGQTVYRKVFCFISAHTYKFNKLLSAKPHNYKGAKQTIDDLVDTLKHTLKQKLYGKKKVGVFFSGGVDSLLLVLVLESLGIPFKLYTFKENPSYKENYIDLSISETIAKYKNWSHEVVNIDYKGIYTDQLKQFMTAPSLKIHRTDPYFISMQRMKVDDVDIVLSGAGFDVLQNFCLTGSLPREGFIPLAKRFYVSEFFLNNFDKKNFKARMANCIGYIGLLFYRHRKKDCAYKLPYNQAELMNNFLYTPEMVVFGKEKLPPPMVKTNFREALFNPFVSVWLNSQAVGLFKSLSIHFDIDVCLPYTDDLAIKYFYNRRHHWKDFIYGKSELYSYIGNLDPYLLQVLVSQPKVSKKIKNYHQAVSSYIDLKDSLDLKNYFEESRRNGYTPTIAYNMALRKFWMNRWR